MKEKKLIQDIEKFVLDTLASDKYQGLRYNTHVPMKVNISFILASLADSPLISGKGVSFQEHGVYKDQRVIRIFFP